MITTHVVHAQGVVRIGKILQPLQIVHFAVVLETSSNPGVPDEYIARLLTDTKPKKRCPNAGESLLGLGGHADPTYWQISAGETAKKMTGSSWFLNWNLEHPFPTGRAEVEKLIRTLVEGLLPDTFECAEVAEYVFTCIDLNPPQPD